MTFRIEVINLPTDPTDPGGNIGTPLSRQAAQGGGDPLSRPQRAAVIGDSVPIVFGRRVGNAGGVLVSPPATEARFENDNTNAVTAYYHMVVSEGVINGIQVRDVFQQSCRVGTFTIAYNRRAGGWGPGNFIEVQTGFENQVPDCPIYCGSATGSYAGMTTASFIVTIPNGFNQWNRQVHIFVRGGMHVARLLEGNTIGPSNNVADLYRWALQRSSRIPASLFDPVSLAAAARFTNTAQLWFNGIIDKPSNLAEGMSKLLQYFLLRETRSGGRRGLRPLLPVNPDGTINTGPVSWVHSFNEDQILPGSFSIAFVSRADRAPFCCQVVWRQQPEDGLGLARTAEVRYAGSALDGPFEQHDLSGFATTETHAFRVGAFILARRRYVDHRISFRVRPGDVRNALNRGDIVRVTHHLLPSRGGDYTHDFLYEVEQVSRGADGSVEFKLTHFPVDDQVRSLVARDVAAAMGNGVMLPTGRAPVSCDINDAADTTVVADVGPWEEWTIEVSDPPIYGGELPDGIGPDVGDGWGPGGTEQNTINGGGGLPDDSPSTGDAYTAAVSFSEPLVTYPDVFYAALEPNYVSVKFRVSVSTPPLTTLQLIVTDGVSSVSVLIPPGEIESDELTFNSSATGITGCTSRALTVASWSGGGYVAQMEDGETAFAPALDTEPEGPFQVCAYSGTISWLPLGIWEWDADESEWLWAGGEEGSQVVDASWTWDVADQEFVYTGDETDWLWLASTRTWSYIGSADPVPAEPAKPPQVPDTTPPGGGYTTLTVWAEVDNMPVPNSANDLELDLYNGDDVFYGTLTIPAVSHSFGDHWRWVPATGQWQYTGNNGDWRWHPQLGQWEYLTDRDWVWDTSEEEFTWQGAGAAPPEPPGPPAQGENLSTFPPNAANWTYDRGTGTWIPPIAPADAYALNGNPPDASPYDGFKTLHFLN
jgi:hypothetical protein